eukprot:299201-Rhodomonas_salina.1
MSLAAFSNASTFLKIGTHWQQKQRNCRVLLVNLKPSQMVLSLVRRKQSPPAAASETTVFKVIESVSWDSG